MDKDAAGRTSGQGFYYLLGDKAKLHEPMIAYIREFMIEKWFTYAIPPFIIHSDVVSGVMSFPEMEAMMYKIKGEDLYLIRTSEHSMIGRFKDQIVNKEDCSIRMTSCSHALEKRVEVTDLKKEDYIEFINLKNKKW